MDRKFARPKVFIGSATESLDVARAIQNDLDHETEAVIWLDSEFATSTSTLSSLLKSTTEYDFAIFVLTPDDETVMRDRSVRTTRANVIFELGMFLSALGVDRTFFVVVRGETAAAIPSDLLGITPLSYDPNTFLSNRKAALRAACSDIREKIEKVGLSPTRYFRSRIAGSSLVVIDESLGGSPLALDSLLSQSRAKNELFLAAQNHYHVLVKKEPWFKQEIFKFLQLDPENNRVRFLLCDPDSSAGKEAWRSLFQNSDDYEEHLSLAYENITAWVKQARISGLKLEAACIPLVPVSVNFIDPTGDQGLAIITPNAFEHKNKARTAYLLSRTEHKETFEKYWLAYEYAFENPTQRI